MRQIPLGLALIALPSAAAAAPIEGRWQNPKDSVIVNVAPCGAGTWCGKVSWASPKAKRKTNSSLVGSSLLTGLKADRKGGYRGRVYLPKRRMHAIATVRPIGADSLLIKGCVLAGVLCRAERWTRVR